MEKEKIHSVTMKFEDVLNERIRDITRNVEIEINRAGARAEEQLKESVSQLEKSVKLMEIGKGETLDLFMKANGRIFVQDFWVERESLYKGKDKENYCSFQLHDLIMHNDHASLLRPKSDGEYKFICMVLKV